MINFCKNGRTSPNEQFISKPSAGKPCTTDRHLCEIQADRTNVIWSIFTLSSKPSNNCSHVLNTLDFEGGLEIANVLKSSITIASILSTKGFSACNSSTTGSRTAPAAVI